MRITILAAITMMVSKSSGNSDSIPQYTSHSSNNSNSKDSKFLINNSKNH